MLQFWRVIHAGSRNFMRNLWLSTAATAVMTITLSIIILSFMSNSALTDTIKGVTDKITISVYLGDATTAEQRAQVARKLEANENVQEVVLVSKDDALARYKEKNKNNPLQLEAISITGNTLPASYEVHLKDRNKLDEVLAITNDPAIRSYLDDNNPDKSPVSIAGSRKDAINNIIKGSDFIIRLGLIASFIFVVISTLIIFNTIRMAIFTRREEIEIMKLVGATKWFIRGPFIIEAALYGIAAALIAVAFSYTLLLGVGPKLSSYINVDATITFFQSYPVVILGIELCIGIAIGVFSSLLALGRYLKL